MQFHEMGEVVYPQAANKHHTATRSLLSPEGWGKDNWRRKSEKTCGLQYVQFNNDGDNNIEN